TPRLDAPHLHPSTASVYGPEAAPQWATASSRAALIALLDDAAADGIGPEAVRLDDAQRLATVLRSRHATWTARDAAARDTLRDPRPAPLAALDVALTDGLLRLGDALRGRRADPRQLHPGTWHPTLRDTTDAGFQRLTTAIEAGDVERVAAALEGLRPQQDGYRRMRERLAALQVPLAPIPEGADLRPGDTSVRVPHLRERLTALGYLSGSAADAWERAEPYALDLTLASALARFQAASGLAADSVLTEAATDALNADTEALRRTLALNLERWRWLPDDLGYHYVWVNLPAYEIRVMEADSLGAVAETLRMPGNIGNAQTTGWTTPVLTDSIHTLEFQPVWYVPASLAAAQILPMAQADSLALWRQGIEAFRNGSPVDTRLVPWDSVSVAEFRFVQRPGPANPLGRVKFMMHNPYAILIHDTNKRHTLADGVGSPVSSGCVHAGAPDLLAEHLLTTVNGWSPGAATAAWRRGPRRGVQLAEPVRTHFVYFTAFVEADGSLRLHDDPYGYDARLGEALGLVAPEADDAGA
ncbi:MAG: L,D-transpeptidase family protein, partial [Bacteroidota bacterium]